MKIATVIGARPQFIKAAALSKRLSSRATEIIIHTGQHYDQNMSGVFFRQLNIPEPDYHLTIGSGSHGDQTGRMLPEIEKILLREKPDYALVYGDTNSTLAGALAASKLNIPIAHVEAGLRSYNRNMPEEINRLLTDHLSTLLFCPGQQAVINLKKEGISAGTHLVGDIMYDSVLYYKDIAKQKSRILEKLHLTPKKYYLATVHRAENTDCSTRFKNILEAFCQAETTVVFPIHPRALKMIHHWQLASYLDSSRIKLVEPLDYLDMLQLQRNAKAILTDSGGVQKEAYMLRTPCVTLRDETEWTETVQAGWNRLTGADASKILGALTTLQTPNHYPPIFGDGNTGEKITQILLNEKKISP